MTIAGSIYGVVLNDAEERKGLAGQFGEKPYAAPPIAPVVYMKPRSAVTQGGVRIAAGAQVIASPTFALLFARDATRVEPASARAHVGGVALALDIALPQANYYRPAVAQRNGDGFLPLGAFAPVRLPADIRLHIDGGPAFGWSLDRLVRPVDQLIADLSAFMTLRAGDVLLIGLPGDAPRAGIGQTLRVEAPGLPTLDSWIEEAQP